MTIELRHTLSGLLTPPTIIALLFPAALFFAKSFSCLANSALRSKNELVLTPAALALFLGAIRGSQQVNRGNEGKSWWQGLNIYGMDIFGLDENPIRVGLG